MKHEPVLLYEAIEALNLAPDSRVVDATAGYGGHLELIEKKCGHTGQILGIDCDIEALNYLKKKFQNNVNIKFVYGNYKDIDFLVQLSGLEKVDAILLDLGISTPQLISRNGISYMKSDAQLDMRMDMSLKLKAENIINKYSYEKLKNIIKEYGEEKKAAQIAKNIVEARKTRPIKKVGELVEIIKQSVPVKTGLVFRSMARVFQALRIKVNNELENLKEFILRFDNILASKGRVAIITYHSLEDRIVKRGFKSLSKNRAYRLVYKKPLVPQQEEIERNPKADSAKLRVIEKC